MCIETKDITSDEIFGIAHWYAVLLCPQTSTVPNQHPSNGINNIYQKGEREGEGGRGEGGGGRGRGDVVWVIQLVAK